jgi:hypothetical protein
MVRPEYENSENRKQERRATEAFRLQRWPDNVTSIVKLPRKSSLDFAAVRSGEVIGIGEIKVRTNDHTKYDTYMISMDKWHVGCSLSSHLQLPVWLIVQFTDKLMYVPMAFQEGITYAMGGRDDRGDPADQEPVVLIPMGLFSDVEADPDATVEAD